MTFSFATLDLVEPLQRALRAENYEHPTPIQARAIPPLLAGRDLLGIAQTGTGKTAAFALPILQRLSARRVASRRGQMRALVLSPTRELAIQIDESFRRYGRHLALRSAVIFGGVGQGPQVEALARGLDIVVATPGRLLDLIEQRHLRLDQVEIFVLDEADRMLDMGFIHDIKRVIAALPQQRQSLFFSATLPEAAARLASGMLKDAVRIAITPQATTVERIAQRVYFVDQANKRALLADLLKDRTVARALVFTRTKHGANRVAEQLMRSGIGTEAIHGNKSQAARQRALANFRDGKARVLVATDIAARGIDIDGITHVINYELPNLPESYVHRIGRTARAGADGVALAFCDASERAFLRDIEKLTRQSLVIAEHRFAPAQACAPQAAPPQSSQGKRRQAAQGPRRRRRGPRPPQGAGGQPSRALSGFQG
ncbi:MAG TPA: DEAD/DEAH box helicase [Stellaceae bacterium]|nr:DEAD/DEAH box helicase [Stellaceae bacterium]